MFMCRNKSPHACTLIVENCIILQIFSALAGIHNFVVSSTPIRHYTDE